MDKKDKPAPTPTPKKLTLGDLNKAVGGMMPMKGDEGGTSKPGGVD